MTATEFARPVAGTQYDSAFLDSLQPLAVWMPLSKSYTDKTTGRRMLSGLASTPDLDAQGEVVLQSGIDFGPLLERGYVNWNHQDDPAAVIGVPLEARITKSEAQPAMFVRACLYEGVPKADAAWNLMQVMEKSAEQGLPERRLGWSVEGGILARHNNFVAKSVVRMLALTHEPVNYNTFAELAKSMAGASGRAEDLMVKGATLGSDSPLLLQNLAGGKKSAREVCLALFGKDPDECQTELGRFKKGRVGMFTHLVYHQNWPIVEASNLVRGLHKSLTT